jgi:hypothetical protein
MELISCGLPTRAPDIFMKEGDHDQYSSLSARAYHYILVSKDAYVLQDFVDLN